MRNETKKLSYSASKITVLFSALLTISSICTYTYQEFVIESYHELFKYVGNWKTPDEDPCACWSCITHMTDDWFAKRFRPDIHPFLSMNNSKLDGNIYRWWKKLQRIDRQPNYTAVVKTLFKLIPGEGHYMDAGPDRCRSCSVVGNSGNLIDSHYGPLIDSSDFVFRMNKAPTQGYEKDVGRRTTHRIIYPESAVHLNNDSNLVLLPFKTLDLEWIVSALTHGTLTRTRVRVLNKLNVDPDKVMVLSPTFINYVHRFWLKEKGNYPSTGILTLICALHICDEVRVFGFGASQKGAWNHYFERLPRRFKGTGQHEGKFEKVVIKELFNRKKIELFAW